MHVVHAVDARDIERTLGCGNSLDDLLHILGLRGGGFRLARE